MGVHDWLRGFTSHARGIQSVGTGFQNGNSLIIHSPFKRASWLILGWGWPALEQFGKSLFKNFLAIQSGYQNVGRV